MEDIWIYDIYNIFNEYMDYILDDNLMCESLKKMVFTRLYIFFNNIRISNSI